jgi:hypothetical protein
MLPFPPRFAPGSHRRAKYYRIVEELVSLWQICQRHHRHGQGRHVMSRWIAVGRRETANGDCAKAVAVLGQERVIYKHREDHGIRLPLVSSDFLNYQGVSSVEPF